MLRVRDGIKLGLGMLIARFAWLVAVDFVSHLTHQVKKSQTNEPEQDKVVVLDQEA